MDQNFIHAANDLLHCVKSYQVRATVCCLLQVMRANIYRYSDRCHEILDATVRDWEKSTFMGQPCEAARRYEVWLQARTVVHGG